MIMNAGSTQATAILRGLYLAVGTFAATFLSVWGTTDDLKAAAISAGIVGLGALGFRAGVEGISDSKRDAAGAVLPGDVGQPSAK
jgi:hypothetical protein